MQDVAATGDRTVLFVSHNMGAVRQLCGRAIVLDAGKVVLDGSTERAVERYLGDLSGGAVVSAERLQELKYEWQAQGRQFFAGREVSLLDRHGEPREEFWSDEPITIVVTFDCMRLGPAPEIIVELMDGNHQTLLRTEAADYLDHDEIDSLGAGQYRAQCVLPPDLFGERRFYVSVHLIRLNVHHLGYRDVTAFNVRFRGYGAAPSAASRDAYLRPRLQWEITHVAGGVG